MEVSTVSVNARSGRNTTPKFRESHGGRDSFEDRVRGSGQMTTNEKESAPVWPGDRVSVAIQVLDREFHKPGADRADWCDVINSPRERARRQDKSDKPSHAVGAAAGGIA